MAKTITQKVVFKNTTTKALYDLYMNEKKHSEITGSPAKISNKEGAPFVVHGGYITGKNLHLVKDKLIVQTWKAEDWGKDAEDSIFIITLTAKGKDVVLKAIHANVPSKHVDGIKKGWFDFYWDPWKEYLSEKMDKK